jgi:hypothetical protein
MSVTAEVAAAALWLARLAVDAGPTNPDDIKPGYVALVIVLLLCVATTLLWLNMRKQLRKIHFEEKETPKRRGAKPPTP